MMFLSTGRVQEEATNIAIFPVMKSSISLP